MGFILHQYIKVGRPLFFIGFQVGWVVSTVALRFLQMIYNKLLKYTPAAKYAASAGQPTLRFGCPLAKR